MKKSKNNKLTIHNAVVKKIKLHNQQLDAIKGGFIIDDDIDGI